MSEPPIQKGETVMIVTGAASDWEYHQEQINPSKGNLLSVEAAMMIDALLMLPSSLCWVCASSGSARGQISELKLSKRAL
jgi:hypothetical protein